MNAGLYSVNFCFTGYTVKDLISGNALEPESVFSVKTIKLDIIIVQHMFGE